MNLKKTFLEIFWKYFLVLKFFENFFSIFHFWGFITMLSLHFLVSILFTDVLITSNFKHKVNLRKGLPYQAITIKKREGWKRKKLSFNFPYIGYSLFGFQIAKPQFYIYFNKLIICDFTFHLVYFSL
jgi:hypothetical protein